MRIIAFLFRLKLGELIYQLKKKYNYYENKKIVY